MLIEIGLVCLAHGITSLIVHGLPSAVIAAESLAEKDIYINTLGFSLIWVLTYTALTPIAFYRLFQSNDKWIPVYSYMILQGFLDEEM